MRAVIHGGCLLPLALLIVQWRTGQLAPNPYQLMELRTGRIAISLLTFTLLVSPLARLTRQTVFLRARRPLGLYTFLYVCLHIGVLVILDYGFDYQLLIAAYRGKPFILFGFATAILLASLALTSFKWWQGHLGVWWQRLHRLIYLAALLDLSHYFLAVKGNLFSLSGNIARPLIYAFIIVALMLLRLPGIIRARKSRMLSKKQSEESGDR